MKRFTIIFSILLVLGFAGTLAYVGTTPEFINPAEAAETGEDMSAPIWSMTMDDMLDYLEEKGFLDRSSVLPIAEGVATVAYNFDGGEIYWWDVDNLVEGSNEAAAYQDIVNGEPINLYQKGQTYMTVTKNGPFALNNSWYTGGDPNALMDAFEAFGRDSGGSSGSPDDRSSPVWSKTLDDLADYMAEQGVFGRDDYGMLSYRVETKGRVGYHFAGKINIEYYDMDSLDEDSQRQYDDFAKTGSTIYEDGSVGYAWVNGPFTLAFYEWGTSPVPEEDRPAIVEIFLAFGKE